MGQEQSEPSEGSEDPSIIQGPARANATVLGLVEDPTLQRDSLTSIRVGNRQFWTSRDATCFDGEPFFFFTSTASWSDFDTHGKPVLTTYGGNDSTYFHTGPGRNHPHGNSGDGQERWLLWPDSRPLPVSGQFDTGKLYTWIKNVHQNPQGEVDTGDYPSTSLYCSDHHDDPTDKTTLPPVTIVNPTFWPSDHPSYGTYGWTFRPTDTTDPHVYLYAHAPAHGTTISRVPLTEVENPAAYTFYSSSTRAWLTDPPTTAAAMSASVIPNAGTGQQGTFHHSRYFGRYLWIGGRAPCSSEFQVATAPEPWGPWTAPRTFYVAPPGEKFAGYSWQAHPGLSGEEGEGLADGREVYLTFTRINRYYENVIIRVEWH